MIIVALCLTAMFTLSSFKSVTVSAAGDVETILIGDVIEAKDFKISHGGSKVNAENMTIVYPNGGVYGGDSFEVRQAGIYQITYKATVNGQTVEQTQKYKALRRPQDMIVGEEGMQISYGKFFVPHETLKVQKDVKGAIVNFRSGQTIGFATNIPTAKLTEDFNIFDLIVMPSVYGETDFERLTVRITDTKDETNFVEIVIDSSNTLDGNGQISYVKAGANGQHPGGYEGSTYHTANYGTAVEHSFRGLARQGESREQNVIISEHSITVAIDNESKQVFCGPKTNTDKGNLLVNDLDDAAHYKSNPWGGFTSDEVSVQITAGKFSKVEGVVLVKSFAGFSLANNINDTEAPTINVDYDLDGVMPTAVAGDDFPLFSYEAKDLLDKELIENVWVYYLDGGNKITIPNDGKTFNAKYEGDYVIVYSAEDLSGNATKKEVQITAVKTAPNIFVAIGDSLQEYDVYSTVKIAQDFEVKVFGGSGKLSVERTVYDPQKNVLEVKDRVVLEKLGDYKVVYKVTDYLGNVEYKVVTLRSKGTLAPVFVEEPRFESQLVKGFVYELPNPLVVDTADGVLKEVKCEIYVNDVLTEGSFTADGEVVRIRYVAKGSNGQETTKEIEIGVVETEYGKYKSRYFFSNEAQITDELTHVAIAFEEDTKVEFINALSTKNLILSLSYELEKINFKTMKVVFVDGANANLKVTVTFSFDKDSNRWYMSLNGVAGQIPFAVSDNMFSLNYNSTTRMLVDASGIEAGTIIKCDNGDNFFGFSESVYVSFEFGSVSSASTIFLNQICNQSMGYNKATIDDAFDEIEPVIILDGVFINRQKLGTKAMIPTAKAFDVLGQIAKFTITVKLNSVVVAEGPATETIDLLLDKAGRYQVLYYAEDNVGNFKQIPYVIIVNDETAPTLTVKGKVKSEYKLGAEVKIPKYSATDNGENCYIQVCVILPNNEMRLLHYVENGKLTSLLSFENKLYESAFKADENTFYANSVGKYTIRILAYDEYYNVTVQEFEFIVK